MTTKQKIMTVVESFPDEISVEQAIDRLYLLEKIETGLLEADAGDVIDHDDLMRELIEKNVIN